MVDGIAIFTFILINVLIGFDMEFQARRSLNTIKKLSAVPAKALRNKKLEEIILEGFVPGDVVYIGAVFFLAIKKFIKWKHGTLNFVIIVYFIQLSFHSFFIFLIRSAVPHFPNQK